MSLQHSIENELIKQNDRTERLLGQIVKEKRLPLNEEGNHHESDTLNAKERFAAIIDEQCELLSKDSVSDEHRRF